MAAGVGGARSRRAMRAMIVAGQGQLIVGQALGGRDISAGERRPDQSRAREVGVIEMGPAQVRVGEIGALERGALEVAVVKIGAQQTGVVEMRALGGDVVDIQSRDRDIIQPRALKICPRRFHTNARDALQTRP